MHQVHGFNCWSLGQPSPYVSKAVVTAQKCVFLVFQFEEEYSLPVLKKKNQCMKEHNNLHFQGRLNKILSSLLNAFSSLLILCVLLSPAGRKPGKLDPRNRVFLQNERQGIPGDNRADRGEEGGLFLMEGHRHGAVLWGVPEGRRNVHISRNAKAFPSDMPWGFF